MRLSKEEFNSTWIGRKFKCGKTGEVLILTEDNVRPRAFFSFGESYLDLGDGYYSRVGGFTEEIKDEKS